MHMYKTIAKLGLPILALAALGLSCAEGDVTILGTCPTGQIAVGQASKTCLKAPVGAEEKVRQLYRIAEVTSDQTMERYATIVLDAPMKVDEVVQLLGPIQFQCHLVYFYDFASRMYSSHETPLECGRLNSVVVGDSGRSNEANSAHSPVVLSVTGKSMPAQMLEFWRTHPNQVRAVSISLSPDVLPPQFQPYPTIEE